MMVSIHQPNYIPWLGFFHKMARSDVFVFLDNVQFTKNGFQNRSRIKGPQGEMWLTVPVLMKGRFGQQTNQVDIDNSIDWGAKHWKSLIMNYRSAPCFDCHAGFFEDLYRKRWTKLVDLSETTVHYIAEHFGVKVRYEKASDLQPEGSKTELLINICRVLGADAYLSGPSGKKYLDGAMFLEAGIDLVFDEFTHPVYTQSFGPFIPNLSAVDLMFNKGEESLEVLMQYGRG
jgi:hypothetical protein